jgi:fructose-1,6-bisphosphatase II / sedoheptulose-1,7-bisphosphatase
VRAVAKAKGCDVSDILVCVLDRPRHEKIIEEIREVGARVKLIGDGDVAGVIDTTNPDTSVDLYMGSGGAPEGVLAAAALRCIGGQIQGRLLFRNDEERARAHKWGITDLDLKYDTEDMASGDVIFAATGVTDGSLLRGVHITPDGERYTTDTVVMRSKSGTVRWVKGQHKREE